MANRKTPLKKQRCLQCGESASTLLLGRCAHCVSVDTALASGWTPSTSLVKIALRSDSVRLALSITTDGRSWRLTAFETRADGSSSNAEIVHHIELVDVLREADHFARRWLEKGPGTSIATYAAKPVS